MPKKINKLKNTVNFEKNIKIKDNRVDFSREGRDKTIMRQSWDTELPKETVNKSNFANTILILSFAFLLLAIVSAFFLFQGNVISGENIEIRLDSPIDIVAGDEILLDISVINKNTTAIASADLALTLPKGAYRTAEPSLGSDVHRKVLGRLASGERVNYPVEAVLFGTDGTDQKIVVAVDYRLEGSNAQFAIEKEFNLIIGDSPISVSVDAPEDYVPGSPLPIVLNINSNSREVIRNVAVQAEYPFGFEVTKTNRRANFDETFWKIGDLAPNQEIKLEIEGVLEGQNNDERTIRFIVGESRTEEEEIESIIARAQHTVMVTRPFIELQLLLNGENVEPYVATRGREIDGQLWWENNTQNNLRDVEVVLTLLGEPIDLFSVDSSTGFYDDKVGTITWTKENYSSFESISAGGRGRVDFSFSSERIDPTERSINQDISLRLDISAEELGVERKTIDETIVRNVLLRSTTDLIANVSYAGGRFTNTGPIPPKVGEQTTYTVSISLNNRGNELRNGVLKTSLPTYVSLVSQIAPDSENASFDEDSQELLWRFGTLERTDAKRIEFQVGITPTIQQIGREPILVNSIDIEYFDIFTNERIKDSNRALNTRIEGQGGSQGRVVE